VQYDNYSSESELETKLLAGGGGYDVIFPSDRSMAPLIQKGLLADLDKSLLPNLNHIGAKFMGAPYDPENRYSVPYFWGTVAVGIRTDHVTDPVKGFEVLFDEKYKGRITMLDDAENVIATVMLHLGHPMNSTEEAHLAEVKDVLLKQRPLVQAYTSDAFKEKLIKGEAWVVLGWSGDILQARGENENITAVVPETGTMIWVDAIAIPKDAKNDRLAHEFINFLLDPAIAARNAKVVQYATPNVAAREKLDPEMLADPAIYPPQEVLDRCQWLQDRGAEITKIERVWQEVRQ
jgi:spermidine/putrescine-binding protein